MKNTLLKLWRENKSLLLFLTLMFAFRSSFADWYEVPTGSMKPTIVEGDRIFVNKAAYRIDLPFTDIPLMQTGQPERGDIVVFVSEAADNRLVKRVIGLPGDTVAMRNNHLIINQQPVEYQILEQGKQAEQLNTLTHPVQFVANPNAMANFGPVVVPEGHYLVLGDNRNNSADSRVYGFVPANELQGKALGVIVSLDPDNYYLPRQGRSFTPMI